jgi:hypothetical protein
MLSALGVTATKKTPHIFFKNNKINEADFFAS